MKGTARDEFKTCMRRDKTVLPLTMQFLCSRNPDEMPVPFPVLTAVVAAAEEALQEARCLNLKELHLCMDAPHALKSKMDVEGSKRLAYVCLCLCLCLYVCVCMSVSVCVDCVCVCMC